MSVNVITAYGFDLQARRRAIREENDLIFAKIARQRAAEHAAASPTPVAMASRPAPTISDEAFERVRRSAEAPAGSSPSPADSDGDEAAEAILSAFNALEPATANKAPPAGAMTSDGDAAVEAIMTAFRTFSR